MTLTPGQREVLALMSHGLTNREIASRLGRSEHTVKQWVSEVLRATGSVTRTQAVAAWLRGDLVPHG